MIVRTLLRDAGLAAREAEILLLHLLKRDRSWLFAHSDTVLSESVVEAFHTLVAQRQSGTPIAYLVGEREFWSLRLAVSPAVLIPRPDTETLVMWACDIAHTQRCDSLLDMGTGSGAIALALASELPQCVISALDSSEDALAVARVNGKQLNLRVEWLVSDWFTALSDRRWPLIVSNPPYIRSDDPHLQQGDLPREPLQALVAGPDGLACIKHIISGCANHLLSKGYLLLEHGYDQASAVSQLMAEAGFTDIESRRDLAGHKRVTGGRLP